MAAPTYFLIASNTVGSGGAASVTFSSIPSTYTDLVIKASARITSTDPLGSMTLDFNGSGANYTLMMLRGSGSAAASFTRATFGTNIVSYVNTTSGTASTWSNIELYFPNYRSSNYKSVSIDGVEEENATAAYSVLEAGLWSQTAAITSLTLNAYATSGVFSQYSTFTLYGISNA